jgi:hypothetical protein
VTGTHIHGLYVAREINTLTRVYVENVAKIEVKTVIKPFIVPMGYKLGDFLSLISLRSV